MKLLSIANARAIWLVPAIFLNPHGKSLLPLVSGAVERYKFQIAPELKIGSSSRPDDLKFEDGIFTGKNGIPINVSLAIHSDGLVAETRSSTDDAEAFLVDVLTWAAKEFGLVSYSELSIKRLYVSEVFMQFERELAPFNKKFMPFLAALRNDKTRPMDFMHINFGEDDPSNQKAVGLRIERRLSTPFGDNHYYSLAKTPTAEHLALLKSFEDAAT